jgi:hypothetical protein
MAESVALNACFPAPLASRYMAKKIEASACGPGRHPQGIDRVEDDERAEGVELLFWCSRLQ